LKVNAVDRRTIPGSWPDGLEEPKSLQLAQSLANCAFFQLGLFPDQTGGREDLTPIGSAMLGKHKQHRLSGRALANTPAADLAHKLTAHALRRSASSSGCSRSAAQVAQIDSPSGVRCSQDSTGTPQSTQAVAITSSARNIAEPVEVTADDSPGPSISPLNEKAPTRSAFERVGDWIIPCHRALRSAAPKSALQLRSAAA
jgi:hypothetical protein